jgi:hypothetical protein
MGADTTYSISVDRVALEHLIGVEWNLLEHFLRISLGNLRDGQCAVPVTPETPVDDLSRIVDMVTPFR